MITEEQKQKRKEYAKEYRKINKEKKKEYDKRYYQKPKVKERQREYYKVYHQKNKQRNKQRIKEYRQTLKGKKMMNDYQKQRKKTNLKYYLTCKLRTQLKASLRTYSKIGKIYTSKKYDIDYKAIIEHLKPFPKDIRNFDIHHIKPLHTFNFINADGTTNLEEVKKAFEPENLTLITKEEHREIHKKPYVL